MQTELLRNCWLTPTLVILFFSHLFTPNLLSHLIIHIQSRPFNYPFDTTVSLLTQNLPFWLISLQSIKLFFPLSLIHSFIAFIHSIQ